ncbi:hypothetical protein AALP_AA1G178100 [Arabis alpina]|uniref:Zinc knuckle CX2CX4HX4C domain-containing protein n=1 Tax=Arabis alpina TaxID=50452 RepID=A0A087HNW8_ARAAL|nr:hypothetical protein AALP_AA1G178100 [Arabis alpina]
MESVLRRGPWAFAERMLVFQQWSPLENPPLINFIPIWIQIRGIPPQFLDLELIARIGRQLGQLMDVDYNVEAAFQVEYVRVRLNWDVTRPLRFQRNIQFTPGVNTLLRFRYERLRGFCEVCGMLTHDSDNCLIQNGGMGPGGDSDDSDDDHQDGNDRDGPIIKDMAAEPLANIDPEIRHQVHALHQNGPVIDVDEDIGEFSGVLANELEMSEMYNPCPIFANATGDIPGRNASRMQQFGDDYDELNAFENIYKTHGDPSAVAASETRKRKLPGSEVDAGEVSKTAKLQVKEHGESSGTALEIDPLRGAVGPKPPAEP